MPTGLSALPTALDAAGRSLGAVCRDLLGQAAAQGNLRRTLSPLLLRGMVHAARGRLRYVPNVHPGSVAPSDGPCARRNQGGAWQRARPARKGSEGDSQSFRQGTHHERGNGSGHRHGGRACVRHRSHMDRQAGWRHHRYGRKDSDHRQDRGPVGDLHVLGQQRARSRRAPAWPVRASAPSPRWPSRGARSSARLSR